MSIPVSQASQQTPQHINELAQQCVKCGLCLPHCPTYVIANNENESPRGRIALMQGAVRQQVPMTEKLLYHVDTCLSCRACEAVCPAGVKYEELFNTAKAWMNPVHQPSRFEKLLIATLENPQRRHWLARMVSIYQAVPLLPRLFNKYHYGRLLTLASYVPVKSKKPVSIAQKTKKSKGSVLLLQPCASEVLDQKTIHDAIYVLEQLGWNVKKSDPSFCCGALSLHAGQLPEAKQCAENQSAQWKASEADVIVTLASGCHSTMQQYKNAPLNVTIPATPLHTIEEFIIEQLSADSVVLPALKEKIIVHTPCTLRNGIRKPELLSDLIKNIPDIQHIPVPTKMGCCGAAGTNFLRHPDIAGKLVNPIVDFIRAQKPDKWITSNIGCALHIQQALRKEGINISVLHPISLIAQQLAQGSHS